MNTFKQIEICGFKSFADNINISFDGGVTAIVGPNGCGKSNIVDAIRWVLGEQSAKNLRGKSMQDVIFAGTEKRKSLSYCEVALVFDNTKHWFNVDAEEVVISRKLYRSGESEYSLNRVPCRFKDIQDILYDSGIGKDGYSIIGQNRVQEIIVSKPEERRAIFESAAGISKYKARKVESERRLDRTRDNMTRLKDILSEVERRIGPLKKQCEDAKQCLSLRDELKDLEINAYIYQYDNASKTKEDIALKKQGFSENFDIKKNEFENYQIKYDQNMNELNQIDKTIATLNTDLLNFSLQLEQRRGENNLFAERMKFMKQQAERISDEIEKLELEQSQRKMMLEFAGERKADAENQTAQKKTELEELSAKYWEIIDSLTKTEDETSSTQKAFIDNMSKLTDIKANMSSLLATKKVMEQNIYDDSEKYDEIENSIYELENELKLCESDIEILNVDKDSCQKRVVEIEEQQKINNSNLEQVTNSIFNAKSDLNKYVTRRDLLLAIKDNYEGYQYAVKKLLQDSKQNGSLSNAIMGVVGNIITVEPKLQIAIDVALGANVQNIITNNEKDAQTLIEHLKRNSLGRATFLPLSSVKTRSLTPADTKYLRANGCLGVASELIKYDSKYSRAIESLLGSTVIVDTLENAVSIAKQSGYSFRIITLDGDILTPQGSMTGGSKKTNDISLLSKDAEIKDLQDKIAETEKYLEKANKSYEEYQARKIDLVEKFASENAKLQEYLSSYYSLASKKNALTDKKEQFAHEQQELNAQINTAKLTIDEIQQQINSVDVLETDLSKNQKEVDDSLATRQNFYDDLKQKREEYNEHVTRIKVEIASLAEKIASIDKEIVEMTAEIEAENLNLDRVRGDLTRQQAVINEANSLQNENEKGGENSALIEKIESINSKIASFDDHKTAVMNEIKELDDKKSTVMNEISRLENRIMQEDAKIQKVDSDIEAMQERIYEEYQLTYSDCLPFKKDEFDLKPSLIAIGKIKSQISELGYVNIHAIQEYAEQSERYEQMTAQMIDLQTAESDLLKIIDDLSKEMLEKFNVEFEKINENFSKVFTELFGGGKAHLQLLESEDPLNAGVEIIAQPPGSHLQQISLLSGGEMALTAISILFAILKLRPMPFCLLDEIDAALDEPNAERIAKYLQRFTGQTQFVIITHKKPTMQLADALYGLTMEEKGVSKIVSVKLDDAIKTIEKDNKKEKVS